MSNYPHRQTSFRQSGNSSVLVVVLLLIVSALLIQNGYQTYQIIEDGDRLRARIAAQEPTVKDAQQVRAQLLSIGGQTATLANAGSTNAQLIIERLRAQGVTIKAP